ncbi:MAG: DNA-directed RNA polymerase subunit omega [Halanaerobiaceae bacterium]
MINKPSVEDLQDKADSIYTLVILAARRARQINAGSDTFLSDSEEPPVKKPVSQGLRELYHSKIKYKKNTDNTLK